MEVSYREPVKQCQALDDLYITNCMGKQISQQDRSRIKDTYIEIQKARCDAIRSGEPNFEITIDYSDESYTNVTVFFLKFFEMENVATRASTKKLEIECPESNEFLNLCEEDFKNLKSPNQVKFTKNKSQLEAIVHEAFLSNINVSDEIFLKVTSQLSKIILSLKNSQSTIGLKKRNVVIVESIPYVTSIMEDILKKLNCSLITHNVGERSKYTLKGRVDAKGFEGSNEKPIFAMPKVVQLDFDPTAYSDVTFLVEGKEFKMHRVMLLNAPFFADAMDSINEFCGKEPIPFTHGTAAAFEELKNYLYNKPIDQKKLSDVSFCIQLFHLADYVGVGYLKSLAVNAIADSINPENFLHIAIASHELNSPELKELCNWFSGEGLLTQNLDLSTYSALKLLQLKTIAQNYKLIQIEKSADKAFASKIELNADFTSICNFVRQRKDKKMFKFFTQALSDEMVDTLVNNKEKYKEEYKAYKAMKMASYK